MDSRERTFLALNHEEPDRVPIDFWASGGFIEMLRRERGMTLGAYLDAHDVDLRYVDGPRYIGPPLGEGRDLWGVLRRRMEVPAAHGVEVYSEVADSPLAGAQTVDDILNHPHWPSADWFDYTPVAASARALRNAGRVAVLMGDRLNRIAQLKPAMYLRGMEQILLDLVLQPEIAAAMIHKVRHFYIEYGQRVYAAAEGLLDIVCTGDDFGTQNGPLVSPAMWAEFLGDGFRAYIDGAHAHGLKVMHHTCGSVRPIIPLMLDRGLDVLQSLQPEAHEMDLATIKREFGARLAFQGGISIQQTMPFGTRDEIRAAVRNAVAALAPGGGYILGTAHNLQADVPLRNADALLEAYHEFGGRGSGFGKC